MIKKKKWNIKKASLALATVMLLTGILAACSSDNNNTTNDGSSSAETSASSGEKVKLKVEIFDRGNTPAGYTITDSFLTRLVQDKFGTPNNIEMEFVPVPRSEEINKLNVLMASGGDVPDIVFTYDSGTFYRYAEQGGLTELTDLINQYGPNLKTFLGEDTLAYGQLNGEQFAIPGKRSIVGRYASFIRQDWLDKLGMKAPTTTDEFYATLKAFKEKDPGNTGGKVIPLGMTIAPAETDPLIWSFIKPLTEEQQYIGSNDYPALLPGFKDAMQFMNKLYNEGLISKDFGLDNDKKQLTEDIHSGKVGAFSEDYDNPYYNDSYYDNLSKNVPGAALGVIDPFTNSEGKHAKSVYAPNGFYIMIPKTSEHAVEAIKYLDWMASGTSLLDIQNGVEGENYTMVDGIPIIKEDSTQKAKDNVYNSGDIGIIANGKFVGDDAKNAEAFVKGMPVIYQDDMKLSLASSLTDPIKPTRFDHPIQAEAKYGTNLYDKYSQLIVKSTMVKPAEFDETYESLMKQYMASGGKAVLEERTKAYQETKSK